MNLQTAYKQQTKLTGMQVKSVSLLQAFPSPAAGSETGYAPMVSSAPLVISDVKVSDCKESVSPKSATNHVLSH